jgi:hypothetical protein
VLGRLLGCRITLGGVYIGLVGGVYIMEGISTVEYEVS